ncbi:hypothetical protein B296_00000836 [Ensete ventricosum]|uniref:Uncharacterized protein n=1 Tax=Ensete ventricosum TaxID=4639 RepID=A0A427B7T1_ENSVE|nr:hypothetical protein B296_00000836 [Ensete ventricosum]
MRGAPPSAHPCSNITRRQTTLTVAADLIDGLQMKSVVRSILVTSDAWPPPPIATRASIERRTSWIAVAHRRPLPLDHLPESLRRSCLHASATRAPATSTE